MLDFPSTKRPRVTRTFLAATNTTIALPPQFITSSVPSTAFCNHTSTISNAVIKTTSPNFSGTSPDSVKYLENLVSSPIYIVAAVVSTFLSI